eukprot:1101404-Pyramimonas_sp.AAC.1
MDSAGRYCAPPSFAWGMKGSGQCVPTESSIQLSSAAGGLTAVHELGSSPRSQKHSYCSCWLVACGVYWSESRYA